MAPQSKNMAPPSLQRLLALEKNYTDLDQQIREARSILNLRKDWDTPESSVDFPGTFQGAQYHARAEWVLRWLLEKLKVDGTAGRQARGIVGAWNLLDCLITIIPAASAAVLLRAGDYTKSLEKALEENFGDDILDRAFRVDVGPQNGITASREPLESTVTAEELPETSRKRKRGTESESPVKKIGLSTGASKVLFYTIARSLEAVVASSYSTQGPAYKIVANHMRMVLRVDSANAAKLLKSWLNAIILILADSDARATILNATDGSMKLTPMLRIWEMRTPGVQDDTGASVDDFSEHCLLPVTILLGLVKDDETFTSLGEDVNVNKDHLAVARKAVIISLEQLYARHVFGPTRADFFATASSKTNPPSKGPTPGESPPVAMNLFRCLEHIRTRLTLAASLKRMEEPAPPSSDLLFRTIPHLLDVAIRCSPRLTPRTRISEKPWIQAVLVTLLDCTGFILKKQPFPAVVETIRSAEVMLQIIIDWKFPVDSNITKSMLRFPSGVQDNRDRQHRTIWWGLVAQLTALDPDMFLPEAKGAESTTIASSGMLRMVFRQISLFPQYALDSDREIQEEEQRAVTHDLHGLLTTSDTGTLTARVAFPRLIIIPIMKAFARNRDLLGFITRWRDQLRNTRSSTGDPSIWQSPGLISALASLLEVSLTIAQIKNLFEEHHNLLSSLLASLGSDDGTMAQMMSEDFFSTSNASTAMACILIQSLRLDDTVTALQETLKAVQSDLVALADVVAYRASADMTETWTALSLVFSVLWPLEADVYLDHPNDILNSTIIQLANVSIAPGRVNIWIVNSDLDISSRTAAFAFLVTVLDRLECISASQETIFQYLNQAMLVLMPSTMFKHGEVNKVSMALDDPFDRIDSTSSCEFRRCLERLLIGSPKLLVYLKPDLRAALFHILYKLAAMDKSAYGYRDLLLAFLDPVFSSADTKLRDDLLSALFLGLTKNTLKSEDNVGGADMMDFSILLYDKVPLRALFRSRMESLLDVVVAFLETGGASRQQVLRHLALMMKLMELPNGTARLSKDPSILVKIAGTLKTLEFEGGSELVKTFRLLVRLTFDHILSGRDPKHSQDCLEPLSKKLRKLFKTSSISLEELLFSTGLMSIIRVKRIAAEGSTYDKVAHACVKYCAERLQMAPKSGLLDLISPKEDHFNITVENFMDALSEIPFDVAKKEVESITKIKILVRRCIAPYIGPTVVQISVDARSCKYWLSMHRMVARLQICNDIGELIQLSQSILRLDLSARQTQDLIGVVKDAFASFDTPAMLEQLPLLLPQQEEKSDAGCLRLLDVLIPTLETSDSADVKRQLLAVLGNLSAHLATSEDLACYNALLDCIDTILRSKHFMVSQFGIETFIGALLAITSPKGPALPTSQAPAIFIRLCETTQILLSLHRSRLGGRFHLLMPLFQAFLTCLYIPNATRRGTSTVHLPPWLSPSTNPLTPATAVAYTRLLTTTCSPTVSAVSGLQKGRKGRHVDLVDATKQARQYAGQYMPIVISAYCKNMLSGRLEPDMRDRLMPGLWSALDCTDKAALRAMSAAMDSSTRAIWKRVYVEWKKSRGEKIS